jgi:hypothetical protein
MILPRTRGSWRRFADRLAAECHTLHDKVAELEADNNRLTKELADIPQGDLVAEIGRLRAELHQRTIERDRARLVQMAVYPANEIAAEKRYADVAGDF